MFSDDTSQKQSSNGGEYHNQMKLTARLFLPESALPMNVSPNGSPRSEF
jgi:hypothetical protein